MAQNIQDIFKDPQFQDLDRSEQRTVFGHLDKDFAALPEDQQNLLLDRIVPVNFTSNPKKEGLYTMFGLIPGQGQAVGAIPVPYSKVMPAHQAGYTFYQGSGEQYANDKAAEGKTPGFLARTGEKINKALQPAPNTPEGMRQQAFLNNTERAALRVAAGLPSYLRDVFLAAKDFQQGKDMQTLPDLIDPMKMPESMAKQFKADWKSGDKMLAVQNLVGTLEGIAAIAVAGHGVSELTKTATKAIALTPETLRKAAAPSRYAKELVAQAEKSSATHLDDIISSIDETRQREDLHARDENAATDTAKEKIDKKNEEERQRVNKENLKRIEEYGKTQTEAAEARHDAVEKVAEIKAQNDKALELEKERQKTEDEERTLSKQMFEKYAAAAKKARSVYNTAWNAWRDKVNGKKANMESVVGAIKAEETNMTPEQVSIFRDILRQTRPDESEMDETEWTREQLSKTDYKTSYADLPPQAKANIDRQMAGIGMDSVESGALKEVDATRLHGWKSQLEVAVRTTKDGIVRHAVGKVLQSVRDLETQVSNEAGAGKELAAARALTGPYFDAFHKTPKKLPNAAAQSVREQVPQYVKATEARQRMERIAAYDPTIGNLADQISTLRDRLADIKRRQGRPLPHPKDLKPLPPVPDIPAQPRPPALEKFTPQRSPGVELPPPDRVPHPDRPAPVGLEKLEKAREVGVLTRAEWLRRRADWIATSAIVGTTMWNTLHGRFGEAAESILIGMATYYTVGKIADFIEKPEVTRWLAQPPQRDIQELAKLPPGMARENVVNALAPAIKAAQMKGVKVAPALIAFAAGQTAANQDRTSVRREAVLRSPKKVQVMTPDGQIHIFPNAESAAKFKAAAGVP